MCEFGYQVCVNAQCNIDLLYAVASTVSVNDKGSVISIRVTMDWIFIFSPMVT